MSDRLKELIGSVPITFGLSAEKRARVDLLLAEGKLSWEEIAMDVGWEPATLREWWSRAPLLAPKADDPPATLPAEAVVWGLCVVCHARMWLEVVEFPATAVPMFVLVLARHDRIDRLEEQVHCHGSGRLPAKIYVRSP